MLKHTASGLRTRIGGTSFGRGRWRRTVLALASILALALGALGCVNTDPIARAVEVIDNGIRDLSANSSAWQVILQRVSEQLPKDVSSIVRNDAQSLASRSIATAGVQFQCEVDFLGRRAIQSLQALKAELLGQGLGPDTLPPAFCQVVPAMINLSDPPSTSATVMMFGYDLDHLDATSHRFGVALVGEQGATTPLQEDRIGRTTHYQVTLNLGGLVPQLHSNGIVKLVATWDERNVDEGQVVVIPWQPSTHMVSQHVLDSTPLTPQRTGGDGDFDTSDDEPTDVTVMGEMRIEQQAVWTRVYMYARERDPDNTMVEEFGPWRMVYQAPQGWRIVTVSPNGSCTDHFVATTHESPFKKPCPAGEVVEYFEVWVDRDGDEAGTYTQVIAHWRRADIVIQETMPSWQTNH